MGGVARQCPPHATVPTLDSYVPVPSQRRGGGAWHARSGGLPVAVPTSRCAARRAARGGGSAAAAPPWRDAAPRARRERGPRPVGGKRARRGYDTQQHVACTGGSLCWVGWARGRALCQPSPAASPRPPRTVRDRDGGRGRGRGGGLRVGDQEWFQWMTCTAGSGGQGRWGGTPWGWEDAGRGCEVGCPASLCLLVVRVVLREGPGDSRVRDSDTAWARIIRWWRRGVAGGDGVAPMARRTRMGSQPAAASATEVARRNGAPCAPAGGARCVRASAATWRGRKRGSSWCERAACCQPVGRTGDCLPACLGGAAVAAPTKDTGGRGGAGREEAWASSGGRFGHARVASAPAVRSHSVLGAARPVG